MFCLGTVMTLIACLLVAFYAYVTRNSSYWKKKGVPYLKPVPLIGNFSDLMMMKMSIGVQLADIYNKLSGHRFGGFFFGTRPCLMIRDPELVKHILVKDFDHFTDWSYRPDALADPITSNTLFWMKGSRWRFMRDKVTKTFTSSRLRSSFPSICDCASAMVGDLTKLRNAGGSVDIKDISHAYPLSVISTFAFGVDGTTLLHSDPKILQVARDVAHPTFRRVASILFMLFLPEVLRMFKISMLEKHIMDNFLDVMACTINMRRAGAQQKDMIDLIFRLRQEREAMKNWKEKDKDNCDVDLSEEVLYGLMGSIVVAGYETTGNALAFVCYELTVNGRIQDDLSEEIDAYLQASDGCVTYEDILGLPLLDRVVSEVLRKYPAVNFIGRECTKEYRIPGEDLTLEKGSHVYIPVQGLHMDPLYFQDPEKFDPQRFSVENKARRQAFTYMPFGGGPRMCIGMQLSILELKIGLVYILSHFRLLACKETPKEVGLHPKGLFAMPDRPLWLHLVTREDNAKPVVKKL